MAFDVNQFRSQLIGDGARPNLFECQLQFPSFVSLGGLAGSKSRFLVKAAQLPGSTLGIVPMQYFGREVKLAGNRTYADWTVQIINDEDFVIRNAFEQWVNGINDPVGNMRNPEADVVDSGYGTDAIVSHYSKEGNVIKQYNIIGMFPVDVSPIEVDWGANDTVEEFTVTLAFQYWLDPGLSGAPRISVNVKL
jgi:hypothetical protein